MTKVILHSDGGARGNPGPAGIGVVLEIGDKKKLFKKYIGESTNNQAEYQALILGLEEAIKAKAEEVDCYLDSELVVKQLNHEYKVKNAGLASLFVKVHNLSQQFKKIKFIHVFRESNVEADKLVNEAIDKALKK
ncbi:ribonuclease HI family protein [Candidatus Falkowbacteria bacterium]|uniref:Ribonuclease H n=1 Tax=Candidatus Buchananbacteria bacterium CG10_big_fil_rev_8_21_14_0_10_33_19 TaxID=1974525 RepID=A0A2H0W3U2_9BACT|nr:ribonuclease HI family protein [Candidatus Falkowbacteria bacterium]PIS06029.1 MAG: ribonuclease H [Candidatus Buchananbacteria bacterium CG10_big_fil_rev_8_21_14_0_10_33_19]